MDRRRPVSPVYSRQWSGGSSSTGSSSPAMSPAHPQSRLGQGATGFSTVKRTQNAAAKVAAQRLAKVMASQTSADEDDDDEEHGFRFATRPPPASSSFSSANNNNNYSSNASSIPAISVSRPNRSPSPAVNSRNLCLFQCVFESIIDLISLNFVSNYLNFVEMKFAREF